MAIRSASQGSVAAVIFDCDGTLVDTETLYFHSFNRVIAQLRGDAPGMPPALDGEVWGRDCSGRGLEKDARYGVENFDCKGASAETFLENWKRDFAESIAEFGSIVLLVFVIAAYRSRPL
ncbi:unnamed protein product [Polarella glacialis]|uniref:Uncharacterized protein n=1 Tax=Polarella glacialis TaxID=89957 RepID=A0A813M6X2_POLGL|nr:unnamed protein product [Polarella glacialis]